MKMKTREKLGAHYDRLADSQRPCFIENHRLHLQSNKQILRLPKQRFLNMVLKIYSEFKLEELRGAILSVHAGKPYELLQVLDLL